ncbi:dynein assembly factor 1, axonemal [Kipferlia bialata]|uniref:Dynein assembly factor 1, axonemal n=1 Tax=Kipferlia bialata TaxID=797122 RepID=A0A9K3CRX7_9EUKA|nr:dynein assembly factor 1, axonemal [Kipferlia bialata]|eukprot:g1373.t1
MAPITVHVRYAGKMYEVVTDRWVACLKDLSALKVLNLASNQIDMVLPGELAGNPLESLNLASNRIGATGPDCLEGLRGHPTLCTLDLTNNRLGVSSEAAILDILASLPALKSVYFMGNDIVKIERYRRKIVQACPLLTYLDERPVFEDERRCVGQFFEGGIEAERAERKLIYAETRAKERAQFVSMRVFMEGGSREESLEAHKLEYDETLQRYHAGEALDPEFEGRDEEGGDDEESSSDISSEDECSDGEVPALEYVPEGDRPTESVETLTGIPTSLTTSATTQSVSTGFTSRPLIEEVKADLGYGAEEDIPGVEVIEVGGECPHIAPTEAEGETEERVAEGDSSEEEEEEGDGTVVGHTSPAPANDLASILSHACAQAEAEGEGEGEGEGVPVGEVGSTGPVDMEEEEEDVDMSESEGYEGDEGMSDVD